MSGGEPFVDSNVFLYLLAPDTRKAQRAEEVARAGGMVSVQVLNEFAAVARRKFKAEWPVIEEILVAVRAVFRVQPLDLDTQDLAIGFAKRAGLNMYDALIVASAHQARCSILLTEDMNSGQRIGAVTIRNPFV